MEVEGMESVVVVEVVVRREGQMPRMTECEAFLFTHEIIDNLGSTSGGTGPES